MMTIGAAFILGMAGGAATAPTRPATRPAATGAANVTAQQHYDKASALFEQGNYKDALTEDELALAADPSMSLATVLHRVLLEKLTGSSTATTTATTHNSKTLTALQVSTIRLMESPTSGDAAPSRGAFRRAVLERITGPPSTSKSPMSMTRRRTRTAAFVNPRNFPAVAQEIRDSTNFKFIEQISVTNDPPNMNAFNTMVHPYVLQNCATAECHGGDKGGNFKLVTTTQLPTPEIKYTNFFLMCNYNGPNGAHMIDRDEPDNSLLLQYSLPYKTSKSPHPKMDIGKIGTSGDARYRQISDWIRNLASPMPNYNIAFSLPGATPTTATSAAATASSRPR